MILKHRSLQGLLALFLLMGLVGCETATSTTTKEPTASTINKVITGTEAKAMMDQNKDVVILDVRTQQEYDEGHIKGALLLPHTDITSKAASLLPDKSKTILIYCRSGRRSALAATDLASLGYTKLYDFGGIIDWTYEIIPSK